MINNKDPVHLVVVVWFYDKYNFRFHTMKFYRCRISEAKYVASVYAKIMYWQIDLITFND